MKSIILLSLFLSSLNSFAANFSHNIQDDKTAETMFNALDLKIERVSDYGHSYMVKGQYNFECRKTLGRTRFSCHLGGQASIRDNIISYHGFSYSNESEFNTLGADLYHAIKIRAVSVPSKKRGQTILEKRVGRLLLRKIDSKNDNNYQVEYILD